MRGWFTLRLGKSITMAATAWRSIRYENVTAPPRANRGAQVSTTPIDRPGRFTGSVSPGIKPAPAIGTRASANTSGSNSTWAKTAGEIADHGSAPNEECQQGYAGFFCRTVFRKERALSKIAIRPFDLMSRRHPLSSTRAFRFKIRFGKQTVLRARVTCRHQTAGNS